MREKMARREDKSKSPATRPTCGIVMPISGTQDYPAAHWSDVREILTEAIEEAGYDAALVSDGDGVTVIHKRIVQNLYDYPIVVCDVSSKNPNVMFELGLRLAFDKPTIVVKDDATSYSFDTSPIEHLGYPRDLRFAKIVDFKEKLVEKISNTAEAANDPAFSTFLKSFGDFTKVTIDQREIGSQEYILEAIRQMQDELQRFTRHAESAYAIRLPIGRRVRPRVKEGKLTVCLRGMDTTKLPAALHIAETWPTVSGARATANTPDHPHIIAISDDVAQLQALADELTSTFPDIRQLQ